MPDISYGNNQNSFPSQNRAERAVNTDFTVTTSDGTIWVDATSGNINGTLPDPTTTPGQTFTIKRTDTAGNKITMTGTNATIDGATSFIMVGTNKQSYGFTAASNGTYGVN